MNSVVRHYASANDPLVKAVIAEMFRYNDEEQAQRKIDFLANSFICSRRQLVGKVPSVHLWIRGYALEEGDAAAGIIGNFAVVSYQKREDRFVLTATKIPTERKFHPQLRQIKRTHANWGHPVLRAIRREKSYTTIESAQKELDLLHLDFPNSTIPNPGRLYIMIYCADRPAKDRMVRHIIEIDALDDGKFILRIREQNHKKKRKKPQKPQTTQPSEQNPENKILGKHTAKLQVKRKKR